MKKILIGFLLVFVTALGLFVMRLDPSMQPLDAALAPDAYDRTYHHRAPVVLVCYGDGPEVFQQNQNSLASSAVGRGIDEIRLYRRGHMDPDFYAKNKAILDQKQGAGFWLWKPYFILKTMKELPDGAFIVYADSAVVFSKPLTALWPVMKDKDFLFLGHGNPIAFRTTLKKEAVRLMGLEGKKDILEQQNIWAFFMVIRNTPRARALVEKWLSYCEDARLLTNDPFDAAIQDKDFSWHQHDQSILSAVVAENPERTLIIRRQDARSHYGIHNFHRHPERYLHSPWALAAGVPHWLADWVYNNPLWRGLRWCYLKTVH